MKKLKYIIVLVLCFNFTVKSQNKPLIDSLKYNEIKEQALKEYFDKIEKITKSDPLLFKNYKGDYTNQKAIKELSKILLKEENATFNLVAKKCLTPKEFKYFKSIVFTVNENTNIPLISVNNEIIYSNTWILEIFLQSLTTLKGLNVYEQSYYALSSKIEQNIAPDYLVNSIDFSNNKILQAIGAQQFYLNFFIIMHELYHIVYDDHTLNLKEREINADSFAMSKCREVINTKMQLTDNEVKKYFANYIGSDFEEKIIVKDKCNYTNFISEKIRISDMPLIFLGKQMMEILMYRDVNTSLINPENLILSIERNLNLNRIASEYCNCDINSSNVFCCLIALNNTGLNETLELFDKLKNKIDLRTLEIDTVKFKEINPVDPAIISYQLGAYYWKINEKEKAIKYFESSNLFNQSASSSVLCNMILADIYLFDPLLKNTDKAQFFLKLAIEKNKISKSIRNEIIGRHLIL